MKQVIVALAVLAVGTSAVAAADKDAAERARIRDERTQAQRLYEERERACSERFAVTTCRETARAQRRETMDRLRHQELVLDNDERKQRAAARTTRIREKQVAQESKPGPLVVRERPATHPPKSAPKTSPPAASGAAGPASAVPRITDERARRNKAAFDAKQQQASEHRADVERRNAERSQKTKPAPELPTPKAASAP